MTTALSALAPSMDPLIETPGKGSPDTIIGANEMTKAMIKFAQLINDFIQENAELSVQLANYQNAINQGLPGKINAAESSTGVSAFVNQMNNSGFKLTPEQSGDLQLFSAQENQIMSLGQAQTQGVQTSLTGATNAIQALQQSQNEFTTEAGSTVDTTLANDRIQ